MCNRRSIHVSHVPTDWDFDKNTHTRFLFPTRLQARIVRNLYLKYLKDISYYGYGQWENYMRIIRVEEKHNK